MNLFRSDETPFIVDVAQYAGNHRGRVDNLECWEIRDPRQEPFNSILQAVCEEVSRCRSIPRSSHVLIDIFLRGKTLDSSTAYVMLAGTTQRHRKSAVRHLKRGPLLRDYPGLKVDQWDWPPQALNIIMTGKKGEAPDENLLYRCSKFDIRRLASGNAKDTNHVPNSSLLSIIATNDGEETSRAGTLSCVVTVGQDDFFFAPAHIFMPRPPEEPEEDIDMEDSESDCESEMLRAGSATPSDLSSDSEATTDDIVQDSLSGSWGRAKRPNSPRPSHATEGFEIFSPEHDYALIPVPDGETFHQELRCISKETVERIDAGQFAVSVMTPSRGLMNGLLDGRPTLMRLPYSSRFTRFYPINLPDAVSEGDCGSVVIDQNTKQIYGFIVAASIEGRVAYIASADEILQNITAELGKECGRGQPLESMAFVNRQLPQSSKHGEPSARSSAISHPVVTRVCDPSPNMPGQFAGLPSELPLEPTPNLSPSREQGSKPPQMNYPYLSHRDRGRDSSGDYHADINACQPYEACAHGSSERLVASNEAFNSQSIDCDQVMSSHFGQGVAVYSKSLRFDHMNGCRSLDGPGWVSSPFMSPVSPIAGATLPSISSVNKKTELEEFLDTIVDVFPPPSATPSTLAPQTARVPTELLPPTTYTSFWTPTTRKAKRAWSARRTLSESDDCDDDDRDIGTQHDPHKNTAIAPPPRSRPSDDGTGFVYPQSIHDDLRKPEDSDFEYNCEFCPYYLMEPFQFIQKPWNSCLKPRPEFAHTISHGVSDHAFIRGQHPHRHGQRFITKCALHETSAKGKNKCEHCKKPDRWTQDDPDDPADETHFGGALCLRCYSHFPTRADLVNHHKELNICAYREDLPLNEKMKHLYVTFASSTAVPKFHPSASTPRENGARKRRLKGGQEQGSLPAARRQKNGRLPGPVRQILSQPASSQASSPLAASHLSPPQHPSPAPTLVNTEQSDPMLYPPQPHPYGPHPDEPWCPGMELPSHNLGYPDFSSMPEFSVDPFDPMFPKYSLPCEPVQNAHNWQQHGVQPAGKSQWDQFTDSGFGSMLDEDVFNNMTGGHGI
ncbi:hypothetical protein BKA56DRAFT_673662 [Ilyonectria sp. MPI-CAGE-AT-0026]|nr:hypothetical protein BKA56DRAFT_673662 [Ilyonectria sp. MPI-CAGE-AT-0026]